MAAYLERKYRQQLSEVVIIEKLDLDQIEHIVGECVRPTLVIPSKSKYLQLLFHNVADLMEVRSDIQWFVKKNKPSSLRSFPSLFNLLFSNGAGGIGRLLERRPHERHRGHSRVRRPLPGARLHRSERSRGLLVRSVRVSRGDPPGASGADSDAVEPESAGVRYRNEQSSAEVSGRDERCDLYDLNDDRWKGTADSEPRNRQ